MKRAKKRRSNGARQVEEEYWHRMKKRSVLIAHNQGHTEAQTTEAVNSKIERAGRFKFQDKDAFTREALCAGRVKSHAFSMRASVTQQAAAARHKGHHYDRS